MAVWTLVKEVADAAIENFIAMRGVEGEKMKADMLMKAAEIEERIGYVESRSPETVKEYQDRLYAKLQEVLQGAGIDENRILTEAAIYADKVAVDEETVRLRSHIAQFRIFSARAAAVGKKLDFLVQEMNREANTTGSKCSDADITRAVVDIKCDIEKIREQIRILNKRMRQSRMLRVGLRAPKVGARFWLRPKTGQLVVSLCSDEFAPCEARRRPTLAVEKTRCIEDAFFNEFCGFRRKTAIFYEPRRKITASEMRFALPALIGWRAFPFGKPANRRKA
jgi:hypothetical protein